MFKVSKTKIKNLLIVDGRQYKDNRGYLRELLSEKEIHSKLKITIVSKSKKNVLRGLHFQHNNPQGKYISVLKGRILDVVVDLRKKSKTFKKSFSIILSEKNCKSIYIPPGFAHGFITLKNFTEVEYKVSNFYSKNHEVTIMWNDPTLSINWTIKPKEILSQKDKNGILFNDLKSPFYL